MPFLKYRCFYGRGPACRLPFRRRREEGIVTLQKAMIAESDGRRAVPRRARWLRPTGWVNDWEEYGCNDGVFCRKSRRNQPAGLKKGRSVKVYLYRPVFFYCLHLYHRHSAMKIKRFSEKFILSPFVCKGRLLQTGGAPANRADVRLSHAVRRKESGRCLVR